MRLIWPHWKGAVTQAVGNNLLHGSYVALRNLYPAFRGIAIYGGELFDSPFENVQRDDCEMLTQTIMQPVCCL
jgi:hypothetical protein